jgi:hypothetical protein
VAKVCPSCGGELEERPIIITIKGKPKEDIIYVCSKKTCYGVFVPESVFGVH